MARDRYLWHFDCDEEDYHPDMLEYIGENEEVINVETVVVPRCSKKPKRFVRVWILTTEILKPEEFRATRTGTSYGGTFYIDTDRRKVVTSLKKSKDDDRCDCKPDPAAYCACQYSAAACDCGCQK